MTDAPRSEDQEPVERLEEHLSEVEDRSDEMQERLDHLGEGIDEARRRAEADDLLPEGGDPAADGPPLFPQNVPRGDQSWETRSDDADG